MFFLKKGKHSKKAVTTEEVIRRCDYYAEKFNDLWYEYYKLSHRIERLAEIQLDINEEIYRLEEIVRCNSELKAAGYLEKLEEIRKRYNAYWSEFDKLWKEQIEAEHVVGQQESEIELLSMEIREFIKSELYSD